MCMCMHTYDDDDYHDDDYDDYDDHDDDARAKSSYNSLILPEILSYNIYTY